MDNQIYDFEKTKICVYVFGKDECNIPKTITSSESLELSVIEINDVSDCSVIALGNRKCDLGFAVVDIAEETEIECAVNIANECKSQNPNCLFVCIAYGERVQQNLQKLESAFDNIVFANEPNERFSPVEMIADAFGSSLIGIDYIDIQNLFISSKRSFLTVGAFEDENTLNEPIHEITSQINLLIKQFGSEYCGVLLHISLNPNLCQKFGVLKYADLFFSEFIEEQQKQNLPEADFKIICVTNEDSEYPIKLSVITFSE